MKPSTLRFTVNLLDSETYDIAKLYHDSLKLDLPLDSTFFSI